MSRRAPSSQTSGAIQCVVFDLDGTLVDIGDLFYRLFNLLLTRSSLPEIRFQRDGDPWAAAYQQTVARHPQIAQAVGGQAFLDVWEDVLRAMLTEGGIRLYDGGREALAQLQHAGVRLCLASNTPRRFVDIKLSRFALGDLFSRTFTPQDVWGPKPRPQSLFHVFEEFQLAPAEVLMVGDHAQDVEYGRNAGARTAAGLGGYGSEEELVAAEPDVLLRTISDVVDVVLGPGMKRTCCCGGNRS